MKTNYSCSAESTNPTSDFRTAVTNRKMVEHFTPFQAETLQFLSSPSSISRGQDAYVWIMLMIFKNIKCHPTKKIQKKKQLDI